MIGLWCVVLGALAANLDADETVERSLERSVALVEAGAEVRAALGVRRSTALFGFDPQVQGRWSVVGDVRGASLVQPLSLSGQGWAVHRGAVAAHSAAVARSERVRLQTAAAARLIWACAVESRQRVLLEEQGLQLATRLREGAEERERAGEGSLLDVRLARLQEEEARSRWMVAQAEAAARLVELSSWSGVALADIELPDDPLGAIGPVALETGERTDLVAVERALESARSDLAGARAAVLPPLRLGAFVEQEQGELRAGPQVAATLPLWNRNAAGRAEAVGALDAATARAAERGRVAAAEQAASRRLLVLLEAEQASSDPREEARVALQSVALGYERGELDLLASGLLRQQILQGQLAWLTARRVLAEARIAAALAFEDPTLLP